VIYEYWIEALAALLALAVGVLACWLWWRRRRRTEPLKAIADVAVDALHDIVLPDGMGGQIYIEHLVLTSRGIVVIDVKEFVGAVFASDKMQEWTVIGDGRRYGFPNPQGTLYDRVAAVRQLIRSVPVEGHILFRSEADFSKGRPKHVVLANELARRYKKPNPEDVERLSDAFAPHWAKLKAAAMSADAE
jgi:hypothetical protein